MESTRPSGPRLSWAAKRGSRSPKRTVAEMALFGLPLVLLAFWSIEFPAPVDLAVNVAGAVAMLVSPGFAVLRAALGRRRRLGAGWALVVPLSLAIDIALGTALVLTPVGLSELTLWAGLSITVVATVAIGAMRVPTLRSR